MNGKGVRYEALNAYNPEGRRILIPKDIQKESQIVSRGILVSSLGILRNSYELLRESLGIILNSLGILRNSEGDL